MPRPKTKETLLLEMAKERAALERVIGDQSPEAMVRPGVVGDWSIKDVLAHLAEWEQMCLGWWAASLRGERPHTPAEGLGWGQIPALNARIYERHRDRPLDDVLTWFEASYDEIRSVIEATSEELLWTPGAATFTKSPIATYFVSCTSSHYHWARTEITKGLKRMEVDAAAASPLG